MGERMGDPRLRRVAAVALALVAVLSGIAGAMVGSDRNGGQPALLPEAGRQSVSDRRTSFLTRIVPPAAERRGRSGTRAAARGDGLAASLPVERKVAQVLLLGFGGQDATSPVFSELRRLDLGGVMLAAPNYVDASQLASLTGELRAVAQGAGHVEPLVMATQDGGELNALRGLPPASAAADLPDTASAASQAAATGASLAPLGVTGLLAPSVDVGPSDGAGVGPAAFSDEPERVTDYAKAVVTAYRRARMFAAAKHFPGLGSGSQSTEEGPADVGLSVEELLHRDLVPFRAAIEAGVPAIVVGHGLYAVDDFVVPGSLSWKVTTGLLRRRMHFKGVAITDDLADPPVTALGSVPDAAVAALEAGADMLYISGPAGEQQAAYVAVLRAVRSGEISRRRLDEAVGRILAAKRDYGLLRRDAR